MIWLIITLIYLLVALGLQTYITYQQVTIDGISHSIAILIISLAWPIWTVVLICLSPLLVYIKLKKKHKK